MKDRRKIYQDPWPQDWRVPKPQGTLMELLLILLIGIIAVLYLGYKYYHPPDPVEAQQEGSTLPADLTEAQSTPVGAQQVNAQSPAPMQESSRTRPPQEEAEIQRQWREWQAWTKKAKEIRVKVSQAHHAWSDLIPETVEEAKRYQTDKEWQRKAQEAADKYDEVLEILKEHETNRVLPPAQ